MERWTMKQTRPILAFVAVAAFGMTACSNSDDNAAAATTPAPTSAAASPTADPDAVTFSATSVGEVGTVLIDSEGYTLYLLAPEKNGKIECVKECLDFWPAIVVESGQTAAAGDGVDASLLGTIERPEGGIQVTYGGYPVYLFAGDKKAGQANGQGVQDVWFAITPEGTAAK